LPTLKDFEGIIAISFTNKASNELKERSLLNGVNKKESFFGTIHKFYISEIILSFGKQVFGLPQNKIEIVDYNQIELDGELKNKLEFLEKNFDNNNSEHVNLLKLFFNDGKIFLNLVDKLAIYIFNTSFACRRYLQIKYKYIIIDEFQDCGNEQYNIFMKLKDLGLKSIAVGDLDQSIYGFTGKSASYLSSLMQNENFTTFSLTRNHRCHSSIINYSLKLMSSNVELLETPSKNVFHINTIGDEISIANWIDSTINITMGSFNINSFEKLSLELSSGKMS
jgi:DNA helicase-2/ATP-dependent DNA helicase PcrA